MKLTLIQNPHTDRFVWLMASVSGDPFKVANLTKEILVSPIKTTDPDRDPLIVQSMKIAAGKPGGFTDWQEASVFLSGIDDAASYAEALGHDINSLLEG